MVSRVAVFNNVPVQPRGAQADASVRLRRLP